MMISLALASVMIVAILASRGRNGDVNIDASAFLVTGAFDACMVCGVIYVVTRGG